MSWILLSLYDSDNQKTLINTQHVEAFVSNGDGTTDIITSNISCTVDESVQEIHELINRSFN